MISIEPHAPTHQCQQCEREPDYENVVTVRNQSSDPNSYQRKHCQRREDRKDPTDDCRDSLSVHQIGKRSRAIVLRVPSIPGKSRLSVTPIHSSSSRMFWRSAGSKSNHARTSLTAF